MWLYSMQKVMKRFGELPIGVESQVTTAQCWKIDLLSLILTLVYEDGVFCSLAKVVENVLIFQTRLLAFFALV